ncbi:MAG: oligosaccharide flippase family protein [Clostridia bacterium]|nr:oligosaccharide flippase family protein [Clostridia bacterium]
MKNTIAKNTTSLSIAGFLSKALGAIYKIPLIKIIGQEGLGIYTIIYPVFAIFLVLGTSTFPLGISRYIIEEENNQQTLANSMGISLIFGIIFSIIIAMLGKTLATLQGAIQYSLIYYAISPIILISFILGTFRGYFQGFEEMKTVAISQIIEQTLKILFGIAFCIILSKQNIVYAVTGLFLGIGLSEIVTIIWLLINFKIKNKKIDFFSKLNFKKVLSNILPISFSGMILPLSQTIISIIILPLVNYFSISFATKVYGFSSGIVSSILNIPLILSSSLSMSLLPNISKKVLTKQDFSKDISQCLKFILVFSSFFGIMFFIFAPEISDLLVNTLNFDIAPKMLVTFFRFGAISIFYSTFLQVFNTILQSMGKWKYSVSCLGISAILKIGLIFILSQFEDINMYSIFIADNIGTGIGVVFQLLYLRKLLSIKIDVKDTLLKTSTILLSIVTLGLYLQKTLTLNLLTSFAKLFCVALLVVIESLFLNIFNIRKFLLVKNIQKRQIKIKNK